MNQRRHLELAVLDHQRPNSVRIEQRFGSLVAIAHKRAWTNRSSARPRLLPRAHIRRELGARGRRFGWLDAAHREGACDTTCNATRRELSQGFRRLNRPDQLLGLHDQSFRRSSSGFRGMPSSSEVCSWISNIVSTQARRRPGALRSRATISLTRVSVRDDEVRSSAFSTSPNLGDLVRWRRQLAILREFLSTTATSRHPCRHRESAL